MKIQASWPQLAKAAADARDDLRQLVSRLDVCITAGGPTASELWKLREGIARHAEALKGALKAPAGPRNTRQNRDRGRFLPLWSGLPGQKVSRYRKAEKRPPGQPPQLPPAA
jgi:hypothetical protein